MNAIALRHTHHEGEPARCPGCSGRNWHVGRVSVECAFCGLAMPLAVGSKIAASAMSAGTAETAQQAQGEARQRDGCEDSRDAQHSQGTYP
jgi:hypothetical protein